MSERVVLKNALLASFMILIGIDILDVVSTIAAMHLGLLEENPVAAWVFFNFGLIDGIILLKGASLVLVAIVLWYVVSRGRDVLDDEAALGAMVVVLFMGVLVLSNNFSLLGLL